MVPFHPGYAYALPGALISAFWMFIYGHALGALFAFIYNSIKGE
jgi:tetrahydromethanopterin S-methyltransferase subunit B